jgi:DNA excision repair protein ERCC-6
MNHDVIMNAHDGEKMRLEEQASQVAQRAAEALRQSRMLRSRDSISVPTWTGKSGTAGAPSSMRQKFGSTMNSQLTNNTKSLNELSSNGTNSINGIAAGASAGKALSSAELLARIRSTQERAVGAGLEQQLASSSHNEVPCGGGTLHGSEVYPIGIGTQSNPALEGSSSSKQSSRNEARSADAGPSRPSKIKARVQPEVLIRQICTFMQQRGGRTTSASIVQHFKERIPAEDLPLFKNLLKEIATLAKDLNESHWVLKPEYLQK